MIEAAMYIQCQVQKTELSRESEWCHCTICFLIEWAPLMAHDGIDRRWHHA